MLAVLSPTARALTLEEARQKGAVRIGFANEAPFGFADKDGEATGEAPEIARVVFHRMGIERVDAVLTEWASLIPGLRAGRFDVIAAGMFITAGALQAGRLLATDISARPGISCSSGQSEKPSRLQRDR